MNDKLKKYLAVDVIILVIAGLALGLYLNNKYPGPWFSLNANSKKVSPDILSITEPIYSLVGRVTKVESGAIWIEVSGRTDVIPANVVNSTQLPQVQEQKNITYKVLLDDDTKISQAVTPVGFYFKTAQPSTINILEPSQLKFGQVVTVNANEDLRLNTNNTFTATSIVLSEMNTMLTGTLENISGPVLTLKAEIYGPPSDPAKAASSVTYKKYTVRVTDETEISFFDFAAQQAAMVEFNELQTGTRINVFTEEDVGTTTEVTALRIEPIIVPMLTDPAVSNPIQEASPSPLP